MLRITIAQLNFTVGDIEGNIARMVAAAHDAAQVQSDLIVFSELALCGYYPGDILDEPAFLQRVDKGIAALRAASLAGAGVPELGWAIIGAYRGAGRSGAQSAHVTGQVDPHLVAHDQRHLGEVGVERAVDIER